MPGISHKWWPCNRMRIHSRRFEGHQASRHHDRDIIYSTTDSAELLSRRLFAQHWKIAENVMIIGS